MSWTPDPKYPNWTEQDQRDAEVFAKGFVALMTFARSQGFMLGMIGPGIAIVNLEPTEPLKTPTGGTHE